MKPALKLAARLVAAAVAGAAALLAFQMAFTGASERPGLPAPEYLPPSAPSEPAPGGEDYFGFPVKPGAAEALLRFRPMQGRCAAGFDATSTLHDFSGSTMVVTGFVEFEKGRQESTARAEIVVDARTLDTGNSARDRDLHETVLETQKFPEMRFTLSSVVMKTPGASSGELTLRGLLDIHGVRREVEIPCVGELRDDGFLHVKGQFAGRLTDFGITPPTKLGFIKVHDEILVWFELWAEPEGARG